MDNLEHCTTCDRRMMPKREWQASTPEQRDQLRSQGITKRDAHGMCQRCYHRHRNNPNPEVRKQVPQAVVVEEWLWLADPWRIDADNLRDLAPRLGMSIYALEAAVAKARAAGLIPPAKDVAA